MPSCWPFLTTLLHEFRSQKRASGKRESVTLKPAHAADDRPKHGGLWPSRHIEEAPDDVCCCADSVMIASAM